MLSVTAVALWAATCQADPVSSGGTTVLGLPRLEWAAGFSVGRVSTGGPDWSAVNGELLLRSDFVADSLESSHPRVVSLNVQRAERFGQRDSQLGVATAIPFRRHWTVDLESSGSPSNRFLPVWSVDGGLSRVLGAGWVATGRLHHREYRESIVDGAAVALEKYAGRFRTQYEMSSSNVRGAATTLGHHVVADCFYGADSRDRVRLTYAFGREVEGVAALGVVTSSIRDGSLFWRQHLTERWALESGFSVSDHRSLYVRREIQLGLRCAL